MQPNPSFFACLRALPSPVWILCLGTFLNKFGAFVIPFLAIYMTRLGFSAIESGLAIGAYGAGHLIAAPLGGYLADAMGRRKTIMLSMFSGAISLLLLSQARTLAEFVILTGLTGMTAEMYRPASSALLADLVPPHLRLTAFALYRMAFNAGWAIGPATAGLLAQHSFLWLFIGDSLSMGLFGMVAWLALPPGHRSSETQRRWAEAWRAMKKDRLFQRFLLASAAMGFVFVQMISNFGLHVTNHGYSSAVYGVLISLNGLLVVLCELPMVSLTRRFHPRRVMALGYLLAGLGFGVNAFTHTLPGFAISIALFTLGEIISIPVSAAFIANLAPPEMRGRYLGAFGVVGATSLILAPGVGATMLSQSPVLLWSFCGALGMLASALIWPNGSHDPAVGLSPAPERAAT